MTATRSRATAARPRVSKWKRTSYARLPECPACPRSIAVTADHRIGDLRRRRRGPGRRMRRHLPARARMVVPLSGRGLCSGLRRRHHRRPRRMRRRQRRGRRRLQRALPARRWIPMPDGERAVRAHDLRQHHRRGHRDLRRRQSGGGRRLLSLLPARADLRFRRQWLHLHLRRRPQASGRRLRRRQHPEPRRLQLGLQGRAWLRMHAAPGYELVAPSPHHLSRLQRARRGGRTSELRARRQPARRSSPAWCNRRSRPTASLSFSRR